MRHEWYVLDENKIAQPVTIDEWAKWRGKRKKAENEVTWRVERTETSNGDVSTVFLGLDHGYGDEPPMIFETLVFGGPLDQEMKRYSTYEEAKRGHATMVERVMAYAKSLTDNAP